MVTRSSARRVRRAAMLVATALVAATIPVRGSAQQGSEPEHGRRDAVALRPGDALRVKIWREPDLSGEYMVDERSVVTLPRLGRVSVAGLSLDSLKGRVIHGYEEILSSIAGSSIEVTPLFRIHVGGAVRNPGLFNADPTMTVADALGLAGGATTGGRASHVTLVRDGRRSERLAPGTRLVDLSLRSGDELYVPQGAWLSRNAGLVLGAVSATASLFWAIRRN